MKKYIAILILLLVIGLGLGYLFYQKYQFLNDPITENLSSSINKLETTDKDLNVSLMQLGYGIDNNYDKIVGNVRQISTLQKEVFKNIDRSADPIEAVKNKFTDYENLSRSKMDLVESFKTNNSALINSANFAPFLGSVISRELNKLNADNDSNFVATFNGDLINYITGPTPKTLRVVESKLSELESVTARYKYEEVFGADISQYLTHAKHVVKHMEPTRIYLNKTTLVDTTSAIRSVKYAMQEKISEYKKSLSNLRKFLSLFCVILTLFLIALLLKMKRLFAGEGTQAVISLNEKINDITEQAQKPLKYLNANINNIDSAYQTVQTTIGSLDEVILEARKPKQDNTKISELVTRSLNDYARLKSTGTIERTQNMIKGTVIGVDEISTLMLKLKEESEKET